MLACYMGLDDTDRDEAASATVPEAFDASKGRVVLEEEFLTLLPGEARMCNVKIRDGADTALVKGKILK